MRPSMRTVPGYQGIARTIRQDGGGCRCLTRPGGEVGPGGGAVLQACRRASRAEFAAIAHCRQALLLSPEPGLLPLVEARFVTIPQGPMLTHKERENRNDRCSSPD